MTLPAPASSRLFSWISRGFWLLWLAFPVFIWLSIAAVTGQPDELAAMVPGQAECVEQLPQVVNFTPAGQMVYWADFAIHLLFFAGVLAVAHRVILSCARGEMFVAPLIRRLRLIGITISLFPPVSLLLSNLSMAAYVATGDLPSFIPDYALDLPTLGIGLLLIAISLAMRQAMQLQQEADLTI